MKRHRITSPVARTLAALIAVLPAAAATAYDGLSPEVAQDLGFQPQSGFDSDAESVSPHVAQVGYDESNYCLSCEAPTSHCNCGADHGGGLFKKLCHGKHHKNASAPWWAHRTGLFGEYLYLRPGSSDLIYATEQTDPDPAVASPTGPIGIVNIDAESGFRFGGSLASSECSSINLAYARWDGSSQDSIVANGFNVIGSEVIHPSTATSGAASLEAVARHTIDFQLMDVNYRHLWKHTDSIAVNWVAGVRYGNMQQKLSADQTVAVATGLTNVSTDIDFDGFGATGGLDFETYSCNTGLMLYGKALASLLAGEWNATYDQRNQFGGGVIANRYEDFHATPVLDAELGVRWMCKKRHVVLSSGFLMSTWYETVTTRGYLDAVRAGQLTDTGETMTFSGLTSRIEYRF
jgi:Legionella pneumophila major outer membrane protein precursor